MTKQITLEELLELVTVSQSSDGSWHIDDVKGNVEGCVDGIVGGKVLGNVGAVGGSVLGDVNGNVLGIVRGKINGREWQFVPTPTNKLERMFDEVLKELRSQQQEDNS